MKRIDPIERILEEAPLPRVVEGAHREQLKQRLLAEAQSAFQYCHVFPIRLQGPRRNESKAPDKLAGIS